MDINVGTIVCYVSNYFHHCYAYTYWLFFIFEELHTHVYMQYIDVAIPMSLVSTSITESEVIELNLLYTFVYMYLQYLFVMVHFLLAKNIAHIHLAFLTKYVYLNVHSYVL